MYGRSNAVRSAGTLASIPGVRSTRTAPESGKVDTSEVRREAHFDDPAIWTEGSETRRGDRSRRLLNLSVALIGIALTAPVMVIVALAIRLTSSGPVIFKQERVGLDRRGQAIHPLRDRRAADQGGRVFTMYKFRTMYHRKATAQVWARPGDPRVTPVGRFLRAYRLDELPQLFNVLMGDMNVVGPRPEQPRIFSRLSDRFGPYRKRQRVLPGITGMAQVRLPYDQNMDDVKRKVDADLEYIEQRGFWTDLKIMLSTIKVLLFRRGSL